jgi:hypothetical protein
MNQFLKTEKVENLLARARIKGILGLYDSEKHTISLYNSAGNSFAKLRLPIHFATPHASLELRDYCIILVQSGSAAIGYIQEGELLHHKVFKSYMVRMKQGTSQIKYLKTKGKSKAGSRVRLGNSKDFFENINERLQEWFETLPIDCIAFSCSKILLPFFFNSSTACPFYKHDERIYKIPRHIESPNLEELLAVQKYLQMGELQVDDDDDCIEVIEELLT